MYRDNQKSVSETFTTLDSHYKVHAFDNMIVKSVAVDEDDRFATHLFLVFPKK